MLGMQGLEEGVFGQKRAAIASKPRVVRLEPFVATCAEGCVDGAQHGEFFGRGARPVGRWPILEPGVLQPGWRSVGS